MNRKRVIWLVLTIMILIICISLATYAYYVAKEIYGGTFAVDVTSQGVDTFTFNSSKDVTFSANSHNFSVENGHDVSGEGKIDIYLHTTKKEAKYCYEVNFKMPDEEIFTYSSPGRPELLLDISKRSNLNGRYEKVIDGLDITTKTGIIPVPTTKGGNNYKHEIYTIKNTENIESWKATLTLVYFNDVDQRINDEKFYSSALKVNVVEC